MDFNFEGFGFDGFDMDAEDFFKAPEVTKKAKAKKDSAKKEKAKSAGKGKSGYDCEVSLPVAVKARGFETTMEGDGVKKLSEIYDWLLENEYDQFKVPGMKLFYHKMKKTVYVTDENVYASKADTLVDFSQHDTIVVADGLLKAKFRLDDFDGKEEDEVSVSDVVDAWVKINPAYAGCSLSFHAESGVGYPVFSDKGMKAFDDKEGKAFYLIHGGSHEEVDAETYDELEKQLRENEGINNFSADKVDIVVCSAEDSLALFVTYKCYASSCYSKNGNSNSAAKAATVEKKYKLPLTLFVATFGESWVLVPENFGGKEKITLDELKDFMAKEKDQRIFADKSRKMDSYYNEEESRLSVMFVSGTKGCKLIRDEKELEEIKKLDCYDGFYCEDGSNFRIRSLPHGNFYSHQGKGIESYKVVSIDWERKLPKIPCSVLDDIISYFREDISMEAAVRIYYNKERKEFSFVKANGNCSRVHISYEYESDMELLMGKKVQVMEIHSHNTMGAFFSPTDDRDEALYPGLFGVIGRLDASEPQMLFRAGVDGLFKLIAVNELFDIQE